MKKSVILLSIFAVLLVAALFIYLRDTTGPRLAVSPGDGPVSSRKAFHLDLEDKGSGLKSLRVTVTQGEKSKEIVSKEYESGTISRSEEFTLEGVAFEDGPVELHVAATDRSLFPLGAGNLSETTLSYEFDSRPPVISVISRAHNLNQGGAGLVVYRLNEEPARTGVTVGDLFFPGHRQKGDVYAALFAFPWSMKSSDFNPRLIAEDPAGNERQGGFYYHVNAKNFPRDRITISDGFLESKMPEFETMYPGIGNALELFLKVNGEVREQNVRALMEIGKETSAQPQWEGEFIRQPGATRGFFAQGRTYLYGGKEVDQATHLGVDIAGLAQMPVVAANSGTVVFADYLGIYGNCVIIDHGLGLQSLYAHLSQIGVSVGDTVRKGAEIARSGATGMAGGDHLHFGILVGGLEVVPLEWWDGSWMQNNITGKLQDAAGVAAR